jgi:hypothetical protein
MWIARYGAYPVMWTLAQECDNDDYYERGDAWFSYENNPWVNVAEFMHKHDPYQHPLTGHQENTSRTTVTGLGVNGAGATTEGNFGKSVFLSEEVTQKTGHNWYGAQWTPSFTQLNNRDVLVARDYWESPKVAVNYEGSYCYLWTKDYGARAQGWLSYLNGFFGYGYGAIDIWLYKSTYDIDKTSKDGIDTITPEDKATHWSTSVNFPSATQVGYMKHFFSYINWWELVPELRENVYYNNIGKSNYACATIGNDVYVVYLCNKNSTQTGTIANMDGNATYNAMWFNPRTCEYITIDTQLKANSTDVNGKPAYPLPDKPNGDTQDWVVLLIKNK